MYLIETRERKNCILDIRVCCGEYLGDLCLRLTPYDRGVIDKCTSATSSRWADGSLQALLGIVLFTMKTFPACLRRGSSPSLHKLSVRKQTKK